MSKNTTKNAHLLIAGVVVLTVVLCPASPGLAQITLGVMGDSLSDEYAEQSYSYADNWVEQLVDAGVADAGPVAVSSWGEPRRTGYEYNWARYAADSGDMISTGQHTGLAGQVASKGITHALLMIGANNFAFFDPVYYDIYNGNLTPEQIQTQHIDPLIADIDTALQTVTPTGVQLMVCTMPDYGVVPYAQSMYPDPVKRDAVAAAISVASDQIIDKAFEYGVPVVDLEGILLTVFGTHQDPNNTLQVGGVSIDLESGGGGATNGFVDDNIHPHTLLQGMLANLFIEGFNKAYGDSIDTFSDQELLNHAGIGNLYVTDTLDAQIGNYRDYILVPEPSTPILLVLGLIFMTCYRKQKAS
ncbi:MAG: PEP-CTERM sorting domain-containing protein [Pirellulales bacterium]|nr:PEP-CTERM sorting domain-containing protein [Pirellulales bacterium]